MQSVKIFSPAWVEHRPRISIWQVKQAWVIHNKMMYPIEVITTELFKTIVLTACPSARESMPRILAKAELDIIERWYILLRTTDGKYPIQLYYLKKGVFS